MRIASFRHRIYFFGHHQKRLLGRALAERDQMEPHFNNLDGVSHERQQRVPEQHWILPPGATANPNLLEESSFLIAGPKKLMQPCPTLRKRR
jgi:hypothetical protein